MQTPRTRSMDDMSIRVPPAMPLPIAPELLEIASETAAAIRGEGLAVVQRALKQDPTAKVAALLAVLKLMAFGRTEQNLALMAAEQPRIECAAGCAACCHQNVDVSVPEAILIALQVADPADPRHAAVLATAAALAEQGPEAQTRQGVPCPLLVEGRCSVYEDRPLVCRSVLSPNAESCRASLRSVLAGGAPGGVETFPVPQFLTRADQAAVQGICKDLGLQHDAVDLVAALATILSDASAIDRWAAGEAVFSPLPVEILGRAEHQAGAPPSA